MRRTDTAVRSYVLQHMLPVRQTGVRQRFFAESVQLISTPISVSRRTVSYLIYLDENLLIQT